MSTADDLLKIRDLATIVHDALSEGGGVSAEHQNALSWLTWDIIRNARKRLEKLDRKELARFNRSNKETAKPGEAST